MKITYEFFRSLQSLLSNPNWREPLQARLNEIDIKLKNLRTEANPDINKFLNQIKNAKTTHQHPLTMTK